MRNEFLGNENIFWEMKNPNLKDRTHLKENDYLNTASLVIMKSKMATKDEEYELPSFDVRDESKIKELELNPKGSHQVAYFSFYEN